MSTHHYSGGEIEEHSNTKIPRWLLWTYAILPIIGVAWGIYFWGGSRGWLDRGHWYQLEKAANTTFPLEESDTPDPALDSPYRRPLSDLPPL